MRRRTGLALIMVLTTAACGGSHFPARPEGVPENAVWTGGDKGGAWIDCVHKTKEPYVGYDCEIFSDEVGVLIARGKFVLAHLANGQREYPADPFSGGRIKQIEWWDGTEIRISEDKALYPDGWIEYPFGDGHGKRVLYNLGEELEEAEF